MAEAAEERFLKARLEREALRANKTKDEAAVEMTKAREAFNVEVKTLEAEINGLITAKKVDEASDRSRVLQQLITSANEMLTLPSHEQRTLNTLLSTITARITEAKTEQKPAKKFGFSSKAKLVATSTATVGGEAPAADAAIGSSTAKEESTSGEVFADLSGQTIYIPTAKAVFVRRCTNCVIYALPTAGSLFLSDCTDCTVYCAPHQLRIKSCARMSLYAWCTSRPVIESCEAMRFGGYDAWRGLLASTSTTAPYATYPSHEEWVTTVGAFKDLAWAKGSFKEVDDFHWLKQSQSPHWSLIPEGEWAISEEVFTAASKAVV